MLLGGTRVALGVGLGLLLSDRLSRVQRRAVGLTLFLVGAVTTIPLALNVLGKTSGGRLAGGQGGAES
jgi:EamA domain-containing membrane protein RarD